jgi:hypothetical protein
MAPLLTSTAQIMCLHGGQVQLHPTQTMLQIQGGYVLCVPDLLTMPIVGCPQAGPGIVPCTMIVLTEPAITASPTVVVQGRPAYEVMAIGAPGGLTNGVPPGQIVCVTPGQMIQV